MELSSLVSKNRHYCQPYTSYGDWFFNPFEWFFLRPQVVSSLASAGQHSAKYLGRGVPEDLQSSLLVALSPLVSCPANSKCLSVRTLSTPSLPLRECAKFWQFPLPMPPPRHSLKAESWGNHGTHTVLITQRPLFLITWCPLSWRPLVHIFSWFLACFR